MISSRCLLHSAFRIPHSAFRIPHSAFRIPHSAFDLFHAQVARQLSGLPQQFVHLALEFKGRSPSWNAEQTDCSTPRSYGFFTFWDSGIGMKAQKASQPPLDKQGDVPC